VDQSFLEKPEQATSVIASEARQKARMINTLDCRASLAMTAFSD